MFGRKDKLAKQDKATRELQAGGVYSLGRGPHPYVLEPRTTEAIKKKKIYGFWPGVWYVTVLSLLLFWIPPFGQMIAGYVGGRKAGTPTKGLVAAFVPVSFLFFLFVLVTMGVMVEEIGWVFGLPLAGATFMATNLPVVGSFVEFGTVYIQTFVDALWSGLPFISPYILTVLFGYVGGILSLQHQREVDEGEHSQFVPLLPVEQTPQPTEVQPQPMPAAPQPQPTEERAVPLVMGKKPEGWDMKRDKKRPKW
jgi:hypothetical protein